MFRTYWLLEKEINTLIFENKNLKDEASGDYLNFDSVQPSVSNINLTKLLIKYENLKKLSFFSPESLLKESVYKKEFKNHEIKKEEKVDFNIGR